MYLTVFKVVNRYKVHCILYNQNSTKQNILNCTSLLKLCNYPVLITNGNSIIKKPFGISFQFSGCETNERQLFDIVGSMSGEGVCDELPKRTYCPKFLNIELENGTLSIDKHLLLPCNSLCMILLFSSKDLRLKIPGSICRSE